MFKSRTQTQASNQHLKQRIFSKLRNAQKSKQDISAVILLTVLAIIYSELPIIIAYLSQSPDALFIGTSKYAPGDYMIYYNYIHQAKNGALLFENYFTSEPHNPSYFSPFWLFTGKIAALFKLTPQIAFEVTKVFGICIVIPAIYNFTKLFFKTTKQKLIATFLTMFSGGISIFIIPIIEEFNTLVSKDQSLFNPIDLYVSEAFTFSAFGHSGLFAISIALMIWIVKEFIEAKPGKIHQIKLALTTLTLGFLHIYNSIPLTLLVIGITILSYLSNKRKGAINTYKLIIVITAFALSGTYLLWSFMSNPILGGWAQQNRVATPYLFSVLAGFGALLPLGIIGTFYSIKTKNHPTAILAMWAIIQLLLAASPIPFQRKLLEGISIPLGMLAAYTFFTFKNKTKNIQPSWKKYSSNAIITWAFVIALLPTSLYLFIFDMYDFSKAKPPYFITQSGQDVLTYLQNNTNKNEIILATTVYGQYIPGLIARKSFIGDEHQTINFSEKESEITKLLNYHHNQEWKKEYLAQHHIKYIVLENKKRGPFDPNLSEQPFLTTVFNNEEITIFATELSEK